jgi:hypothetical protein
LPRLLNEVEGDAMSGPEAGAWDGDPKVQGAERRAWIRYPRRLRTLWQQFGSRQEDSWTAELRDISKSGLGLVVDRSFPPGSVLTVRLQTGANRFSRTMLVRVKHCEPQPGGTWHVGCCFAVQLKDDELQQLLA